VPGLAVRVELVLRPEAIARAPMASWDKALEGAVPIPYMLLQLVAASKSVDGFRTQWTGALEW